MKPFDPALLRDVPETRRPVALLGMLGVLSGGATVGSAFALTWLVVALVDGMPVTRPAVLLTVVLAARAVLVWLTERVAAWAGSRTTAALRERVLARWLRTDGDHRPEPARALTLAVQGVSSVEPYVARYLPTLVAAAVVPVLAVGTLVVVDWPSAVVVVLTLPLLPVFAALIGAKTQESTQRRWRALSSLSGHFLDVVRGLPTLVNYGLARRQAGTVASVSQRHRRTTMETLRLAFLSSAALELLATISVAIVAVTVGIRLAAGAMPLETGLVAILLAPEAYWPIRRVGAEFHAAADGVEALDALREELRGDAGEVDAREGEAVGLDHPVVRARGLGYRYPGTERRVLHEVDLDLHPGLTVVTGPSGVGKSTLLELVAGLRRPSEGRVEAPAAHLVSQRPFLVAGTVRENLRLGNHAADEQVWDALRRVGLDGLVTSLPSGLGTPIGDDGFGLSAGQRARLVLARALLCPQRVVLLDEPTAHLDAASAAMAHEAIRQLATERVVVAVTHRPELAALADAHVRLGRGGPEQVGETEDSGRSSGDHAATPPVARRPAGVTS